MTTERTWC